MDKFANMFLRAPAIVPANILHTITQQVAHDLDHQEFQDSIDIY